MITLPWIRRYRIFASQLNGRGFESHYLAIGKRHSVFVCALRPSTPVAPGSNPKSMLSARLISHYNVGITKMEKEAIY